MFAYLTVSILITILNTISMGFHWYTIPVSFVGVFIGFILYDIFILGV
jgi:hypothetical protein